MLRPGDKLFADRYRIVKHLGGGGFGQSYLAEETSSKDRVVVKVGHEPSPGAFDRLKQEFRLLDELHDPAFARVVEVGKFGDERPYLVTEWVDGSSLSEVLSTAGVLPLDDAAAVCRRLAVGLATLHEAGFVHRDIKPSNVMIPRSGAGWDFASARLLDFGVVGQLVQERHGERLTRTGVVVGTPRYMSPEQLQGLPQSPATDVYGLGLLLHEMILGRLPFEHEAETAIALMVRILQTDPEIPVAPGVPDAVRRLLARVLSRDPMKRPRDARAFLRELKLVESAPEERERPARPPVARWVLVGVVSIAAVSVVILALVRSNTPLAPGAAGPILWIGFGLALGLGGFGLARVLRSVVRSRIHGVDLDVEQLLLGMQTRRSLTETLQIEVREIIGRCRALDERVLGLTVLRMIDEYDRASASDDRQNALMNLADLLEKLRGRLSPWYARFERQLAFGVSLVGIGSGFVSIAAGVLKLVSGQP